MVSFKKSLVAIIIIVMVIYIAIIFYSDYQEFSKRVLDINLVFLPLILFFHTLSIIVKSFRQKVLLSEIGIELNVKENFLIFLGGLSMIITPAGLGAMIKSQFIKKNHGHSISKTMPIVLVEKFNDALAAITIVSIFSLVNNMLEIQILMIFLSLIVAIVYFIIRYEGIFNNIINKISKIRFLKKFASNIFESKDTLQILSKRKIILKSWGVSLIAWSFDAIGIYFSFQAFNLDLNIIETTSIAFSAIILGAISFIPAGIGLIETSLIGFLLLKEIDLATASSVTLLIRFTTYWFATFLGIVAIKFFLKKND